MALADPSPTLCPWEEGPGGWEEVASSCSWRLVPRGRLPSSREREMISFASFLIYLMSKKINQADSHPGGFEPQLLTVPLLSQPIL